MIHPGAIVLVHIGDKKVMASCKVKTIHVNDQFEAVLDVSPVGRDNFTCPVRALDVIAIQEQGKPQQWYMTGS